MRINLQKITQKQVEYIEILMNDVGIWEHRYDWFEEYLGTKDIWQATMLQASDFINELKIMKENKA